MAWARRWGLLLAGVLVVVVAIGWARWVQQLPTEQRNTASSYGQFLLALIGFVLLVVGWLVSQWRSPSDAGALG